MQKSLLPTLVLLTTTLSGYSSGEQSPEVQPVPQSNFEVTLDLLTQAVDAIIAIRSPESFSLELIEITEELAKLAAEQADDPRDMDLRLQTGYPLEAWWRGLGGREIVAEVATEQGLGDLVEVMEAALTRIYGIPQEEVINRAEREVRQRIRRTILRNRLRALLDEQ